MPKKHVFTLNKAMIAHNLLLFVLFLITYIRGTWNPLQVKTV